MPKDDQKFAVLYWLDEKDPVPEVAGPYSTPAEANKARDAIRAAQQRNVKPAQSTVLHRPQ